MKNNGKGILETIRENTSHNTTLKPLTKQMWDDYIKSIKSGNHGKHTIIGYHSGAIIKQLFGSEYNHLQDDRIYLIEF